MPLLYLLCADTVTGAQFVLQRLLVNIHSCTSLRTDFLQQWARSTANWAPKLIEALTIVRAYGVLSRYGIHIDSAVERYRPRLPDSADHHVHPILKWLAHLCEHLLPDDVRQLIAAVCTAHPDDRYRLDRLPAADVLPPERFLELWLLHWQSERLIAVGDYALGGETRRRTNHCDVDALVRALLSASKTDARLRVLGENLQRAQIRFNCTSEGFIRPAVEKKTPKISTASAASRNEGDGEPAPAANADETSQAPAARPIMTAPATKSGGDDGDNDDRYVVRSTHAGFALIIDQILFERGPGAAPVKRPLVKRHGSRNDCNALLSTFTASGYFCVVRENLTAAQIEREIGKIVQKSGDGGGGHCDSLVVCVLSHGFSGHVFGSDTVPVSVDRITALMSDRRLAGKPKLLVVQACQGEQDQELVYLADEEDDALETDGPTDGGRPNRGGVGVSKVAAKSSGLHARSDFCIAQSTMPGFTSYRNTIRGTWFIQSLCETIKEHGKR